MLTYINADSLHTWGLFPDLYLHKTDLVIMPSSSSSSPGNAYMPKFPPMRLPSLDFIYRLECTMSPDAQVVGKASSSHQSRVILPISGGSVSGPKITGIIVDASGADWATSLPNESVGRSLTMNNIGIALT